MKFFVMYAQSSVEEYALPGEEILQLERGCVNSEFQFLDRKPLDVEISQAGGNYFPDFILYRSIPLVSQGIRRVFDKFKIDYVFFKPIRLTCAEFGLAENYWLALPPRINCLNLTESVVEVEENNFLLPCELMCTAKKISVAPSKIGRYEIFKLAGVVNQEILVTQNLKEALVAGNFENLFFYELEE